MVGGSPVAPGNYTQQWPPQAPIPSSMLGSKSALFLKNRLFFCFWYFLGLLCAMVSASRVDPGNYTQQWPLQAPIPSSMLGSKSGLFLKHMCFFVFGILRASVCRGEWIPCSSWKLHPTVGSTSTNSFKHAWDKNRAYFLKICCFLCLVFLGLLCGMVSGSPVAPGNYTQQWPLQAPVPSSMLGTKTGPIS